MRSSNGRLVILSCLLCFVTGAAVDAEAAAEMQDVAAADASHTAGAWEDLVRKTQALTEQSRAELARSREQNESLQRLLTETREELSRLREEVKQLRSSVAAARSNGSPVLPAAGIPPVAAGAGNTTVKQAGTEPGVIDRLSRTEDQVDINTAQIKEQSQTKVESDSRFKVRLFGTLLSNTYYNTADTADEAQPTTAQPPVPGSVSGHGNLGSTFRQTILGFAMSGPKVGEARLSASVDFDFFGEFGENDPGNVLGILRMRTASARLDGEKTSFAVGLMSPIFSPLNPNSLAAVYYPPLAESGNIWQWRPQITLERRMAIGEQDRLSFQGGVLLPFSDRIGDTVMEGRAGYESRFAISRRLDADRRLEIGAGGYYHPQGFGFGRKVDSYAVAGDWMIPLTNRLTLSGEAFYGRSITLREESGGDFGDMFTFSGPLNDPATTVRGIRSAGGWTQLQARATPRLEFNAAFGIDDPNNRELLGGEFEPTAWLKNQTFSVNSIYRLRSNFLLSLEYRKMWTNYPDARATGGHVNLAVGYLF